MPVDPKASLFVWSDANEQEIESLRQQVDACMAVGRALMTRRYVTLSDKNFLAKGLALYRSLSVHSKGDWELNYLCLDQESFNTLKDLELPRLYAYSLAELEQTHPDLQAARANRPYNGYCWTLASYYLNAILPQYDLLTYVDSDIRFYRDPEIYFKELGMHSVGIIAHRHNIVGDRDGAFNVGVISFRNDEKGSACLKWWSDTVLNKTHPELATCGDQKYLEMFVPMFGDAVKIVDETFAHGAPWNYRLYCWDEFEKTGNIRWGNKTQPFLFNHFSRFSYDLATGSVNPTSGQYMDHTLGGGVYNIPEVCNLQVSYFQELKEIHETLLKPRTPPAILESHKVSFGMIVLNGDYVLKEVLDSIYDVAHQILIAEGPVKYWQDRGVETSTDRTNTILDNYQDPKGKLKVVHGKYAEKDEQCNAYMHLLDPATDYLWNLDSDEVWNPEDIITILRLCRDNYYTSVGVRSCTFFGGFTHYLTGWEQQRDQFLRAFKVYPGSTWETHRPPTLRHMQKLGLPPAKHLDSDTLFDRHGVQFYHYSYVFPRQVFNKVSYYKDSLTKNKCIDGYFENVYMPWISGTPQERAVVEMTYQGVHEWYPQYRGPCFTAEFTGEHPRTVKRILPQLQDEFNLQKDIYGRLNQP